MNDIVAERIDKVAEQRGPARQYIGASGVGNPCDAYLALSMRGFPDTKPSPQLLRIFREGHRIEDQVVDDLKKAGFVVFEHDPMTGKQYEYKTFGRHILGHADGMIESYPYFSDEDNGDVMLLEIKSMNDAKFRKFQSSGVKISHPNYMAQVQLMMGLSGIKKSLLVAYNKNNSAYASEIIPASETDFLYMSTRIQTVLNNEARKISKDETDWRCRGCFKSNACWHGEMPIKECASCSHSAADPDERWHCLKHKRAATELCDDYEVFHPKEKL